MRSIYCLIVATFLSVAMACSGEKPNVILCMTDDQGWGDTGYNGHPVLKTPHLDKMAKDGLRFTRFYSGAPVCSPTRGSCLTGRHPYRYGIPFANTGHMKKQELTLAEILKGQGYVTGHFGKWHLGTLTTKIKDANRGRPGNTKSFSPPWQNGFDVSFSTESKVPTWDPMISPVKRRGTYWNATELEGETRAYGTHYWTGPEEMAKDNLKGDDSRVIVDRAVPFIEKAAADKKPFFVVVWFHTPHLPVVAGKKYYDMYEGHDDFKRNYYGCITAMDEQMGRLRQTLRTSGVEDNTMIWFCSDNGPEGKDTAPGLTHGLRGRKRSLYEGGVRVPGLLVWPKMIREGRVSAMPCSTSDYLPTVLDALGYELPETKTRPYDGVSLLPLIRGETEVRPRPIGFESQKQVTLVDNQYKIYSKDKGKTFELYDLQADPGEKTNIAEANPEIVKKMTATVSEWRASCKASAEEKDYK